MTRTITHHYQQLLLSRPRSWWLADLLAWAWEAAGL